MRSKDADTKTRILEVASRLFAEKGFDGTSTRDIAAELSIASPSLYHHFRSKEAILIELLHEPLAFVQQAVSEARQLTGYRKGKRIVEGLLGALEFHHGVVVAASEHLQDVSDPIKDSVAALESTVFGMLATEASGGDADLRATMAVGAVQAIVRRLSRTATGPEEFVHQLRNHREELAEIVMSILFGSGTRHDDHSP